MSSSPCRSHSREAPNDEPAKIGVDLQALERRGAAEEPADVGDVIGQRRPRDPRPGPGELLLAPRLGRPQSFPGRHRQRRQHARPVLGVSEDVGGRLGLGEQALEHSDVGFSRGVPQNEARILAGRQLGVADHVPRGRPAERAGERIVKVRQVFRERGQRAGVQADLGVREVVVVHQHQVGDRRPGQPCTSVTRPDTSSSVRRAPHEPSVREVVQPDRQPVRAQGRPVVAATAARCGTR